MYTVLWQENSQDRWDRFETSEEVMVLLTKLEQNPDVCENDVWIFNPNADDYADDYFTFKNKSNKE